MTYDDREREIDACNRPADPVRRADSGLWVLGFAALAAIVIALIYLTPSGQDVADKESVPAPPSSTITVTPPLGTTGSAPPPSSPPR